jgi:metallo-beta-lactamase class B
LVTVPELKILTALQTMNKNERLFGLSVVLLACTQILVAQQAPRVWTVSELFTRNVGTSEQQNKQMVPHKIAGNHYYVGTESLASFHVTTPDGHNLINSDYERNVPTIRDSVTRLGFRFEDNKILLGSHAHADHMEGDGAVVELTKARAMAMDADLPALQSMGARGGGKPRPMYEALHDGSQVKLGNMTLTALHTPGHTPGCTTWTMKVQEGGRSYDALIIGSVGVNSTTNLVGNPALVEQYQRSFKVLRAQHVDIPLGSHPAMYNMMEKFAKRTSAPNGPNPFIDAQGYQDEVTIQETAFNNELKRQQVEGPPAGRGGGRGGARGGAPPGQQN